MCIGVMRLVLIGVLVLHGTIHLLGVAKAFGLAALPQLKVPIGPGLGVVWGLAAVGFFAAALCLVAAPRWWWVPALAAIVASFVAIVPSWSDAWAGAVANVVVLAVAVPAVFISGPVSQRAEYEREVAALRVGGAPAPVRVVTDADLARLPAPVQRYLRVTGTVGHPHVTSFRARMHGRIRSGPEAAWMPIVAEQVNTLDPPARLFYLDATMMGLPVTGYHRYLDGAASMLVKLAGLLPVARDAGAEMTRAETVTLLNDLCVLAPATLVSPALTWTPVDDRQVRVRFTAGAATVEATLVFGTDGRLADFWSDDRGSTRADGTSTAGQRWSTPITEYRRFGPFTLAGRGDARWHAPSGPYPYIEVDFDDITFNVVR